MTAPWDKAPTPGSFPPPLPSRRPANPAFTRAPVAPPSAPTVPLPAVPATPATPAAPPESAPAAPGQVPPPPPDASRNGSSPQGKPQTPARSPQRTSHRKHARRGGLSRHYRLAAVVVVLIGMVSVGMVTGFGDEPSAEPTVREFLLDWQVGHYGAAAQLTTGTSAQVAPAMEAELTDLDATAMFLTMGSISQQGHSAQADFTATVDLAQGGHQWTYQGHFPLRDVDGSWKVAWSPSVIAPGLAAGDRLAVQTSYSPRAQVLDAAGKSLLDNTTVYMVGVTPVALTNAERTVRDLANVAGLDTGVVLGQVRAAPPRQFMELLTLDRASYERLAAKLRQVPGLSIHKAQARLSGTVASDVVGQVGTEDSAALRAAGVPYEPGETIGESGIEQTYQATLAGTPTTQILAVNAAGRPVATLAHWPGTPGTPVKTTLDGSLQKAASTAVGSRSGQSSEIVAVQASTGDILAVAEHGATGHPLPSGGTLDAKIEPGMSFTIVSAAALLGEGFSANKQVPCRQTAIIGGQTFTTSDASGSTQPFATDFAEGCGTAFANLSTVLPETEFGTTERGFGIGAPWSLPVQAYSGSVASPDGDDAGLAADAIGEGDVRVSPLGMALVAAEVDNGTWHAPAVLASDPAASGQAPLSSTAMDQLRMLMRDAVRSGSAHAANLSGTPVFGQAGVDQTGKNQWLSWFVGYRGGVAFAALTTGATSSQAAAGLAAAFLSHAL
jgi:cell division protein FtsI/penicillin-binding protein 2